MKTVTNFLGCIIFMPILEIVSKERKPRPRFSHFGDLVKKLDGTCKMRYYSACNVGVYYKWDVCDCWRAIEWKPS